MTGVDSGAGAPGAHLAMGIVQMTSPVLRVRYRHGVLMTPAGFPDWTLCARAVVELPPPEPDLTRDENRVVDVITANLAMAWSVEPDPLWTTPDPGGYGGIVATPAGWCWAHLGHARQVALVPVELHSAFRHAGGVRLFTAAGRGLRAEPEPVPVGPGPGDTVPDDVLEMLERLLGTALPASYRRFLSATNGAGPAGPGVLTGFGFMADQPFFGVARADLHQDLSYVADWLGDRFTPEYLPIGYVQGGLLAVRITGSDAGSIWYWDDDDPRDRERYTAADICADLLHRCADDIDEFWAALVLPARELVDRVVNRIESAQVTELRDGSAGAGLPPSLKAPWQANPNRQADPLTLMVEVR